LNSIQLCSFYKGKLFIDKKIILKHIISRYKLEEELYNKFGSVLIRNTRIKPIITGEMKHCYPEPDECKQDFVDCEYDEQKIEHHPT
jgi:hypothetical protein